MKRVSLFAVGLASLILSGCLAAVLHEPEQGRRHAPNAADYGAWVGIPKPQLETHRRFSLLPREVRQVSDGSEMWILRSCPRGTKDRDDCCLHSFVLASGAVTSYRTVGACLIDCSMLPESKVERCINDAAVPDGYGAHTTH